ncbi:hypothetical protein PG1513B_0082 [Bifidobacterium pseudolongum subsp. pseudolongum]|uniref:hypothetical protein n=1 Tax=Bifidobacterium pseudolongum TaxID=1694 RepID=UPI000C6FF563|nr:hypothetical protein [Bifidobacterium pseudolongum]PKV09179.1 hypothetical protein CQR49_0084 [Bifidobacterium pseudolongum subsp. pseudolongum]RYQ62238.1 hypothetical protein PG1513B_0082 [Bifidobacterium pseudolongum subsp. pseudolongum]
MGNGELSIWNGHFDDEIRIDYFLEPLTSPRLIEGPESEEVEYGTPIDDDMTIEIEDIEENEENGETNASHRVDYLLAAGCGLIAGAIDSLWVGKFDFDRAREWGSERINDFVVAVAKMDPGYKGDDIKSAIKFLEKKYPFVGDRATSDFGGGRQHHLRDFSHHMSLGGLAFSLLTQFTGKVYGTDQHGVFMAVPVADEELIGKTIEEKLMLGVVLWFYHMVSDMAGSSGSPGKGTGIPGPILSFMKQLSALPLFKDARLDETSFRKTLSKLFNGTLLKTVDEDGKKIYRRFDLRAELGIAHEFARQSVPVLIDECLVCVCYAARRLYEKCANGEVQDFTSLLNSDIDMLLPHGSPLGTRMVTIATGMFSLTDMADGLIHALMHGEWKINPKTVSDFLLHVNVVGVIRFVFAVHTDYKVHAEARKEARSQAKFENQGNGYGDDSSVMRFFELDEAQANLMISIQYQAARIDIEQTKNKEVRVKKEQEFRDWENVNCSEYTLRGKGELINEVRRMQRYATPVWRELVTLEASQFMPYHSKKLKYDAATLDKVCDDLPGFEGKKCTKYRKTVSKEASSIKGVKAVALAGCAGFVVVAAATGGAAYVFAPAIAPILAGSSVAGLSGAALTSASLAAVGGGSLAAGGLGMAGGAVIIAGGGALLGAVASGSAATLGTWMIANQDAYVLNTCAKLIVFCREVLMKNEGGVELVRQVRQRVCEQLQETESQLEFLTQLKQFIKRSDSKEAESDSKAKRDRSEALKWITQSEKNMKKSVKYIQKCVKELAKIAGIRDEDVSSVRRKVKAQIEKG